MHIFFYIPNMILTIPYNSFCKINEIFNETLKLCVNKTIDFNNYDNESNYTHRQLQRTSITPETGVMHTMKNQVTIESFQNMHSKINVLSDKMYFFIIIFFGFMTYNYSKQIKKFFK